MRLLDARAAAQPDAEQTTAVGGRIHEQEWSGRQLSRQDSVEHREVGVRLIVRCVYPQRRYRLDGSTQSIRTASDHEHLPWRPAGGDGLGLVVQAQRVTTDEANADPPRIGGDRNAESRARSRGDVDLPLVEWT